MQKLQYFCLCSHILKYLFGTNMAFYFEIRDNCIAICLVLAQTMSRIVRRKHGPSRQRDLRSRFAPLHLPWHREQSESVRDRRPHTVRSHMPLQAQALDGMGLLTKKPHFRAAFDSDCIARWGRDSNPRYTHMYTCFRGRLLQPLGHPTG